MYSGTDFLTKADRPSVIDHGASSGQKPEPFTWTINGSTLTRRFSNRTEQLVITSIDHRGVPIQDAQQGRLARLAAERCKTGLIARGCRHILPRQFVLIVQFWRP